MNLFMVKIFRFGKTNSNCPRKFSFHFHFKSPQNFSGAKKNSLWSSLSLFIFPFHLLNNFHNSFKFSQIALNFRWTESAFRSLFTFNFQLSRSMINRLDLIENECWWKTFCFYMSMSKCQCYYKQQSNCETVEPPFLIQTKKKRNSN